MNKLKYYLYQVFFSYTLDSSRMMHTNPLSNPCLTRTLNDPSHDQHISNLESQYEHTVPESYNRSSYEYLSSGIGEGNINQLSPSANLPSHQQSSSSSLKYPNKYVTSASYSPTSYRYPPASIIDESAHISTTYSNNRQSQSQQQLSTSSHSAHTPHNNSNNNNNIANRHLLHPTPSDDSGTESSTHYQQQTGNNTHFVVVAIDFGTTFSGYAFAFTRDIDSILMMRKVDGNDPGLFLFYLFSKILYPYLFAFILFVLLNRCHKSENANDNTFNTQFRISFIWIFCKRLFS